MSDIEKGPWQLRFLIIDKESVLSFLTSNGVGEVVTVQRIIDPFRQTVRLRLDIISVCIFHWRSPLQWFAIPVKGKEHFYTIIQEPRLPPGRPQGLARVGDSNKVILSDVPGEWRLEHVQGDVYKSVPLLNFTLYWELTFFARIHLSGNIIGVFHLLGKEPEGDEVRLHS